MVDDISDEALENMIVKDYNYSSGYLEIILREEENKMEKIIEKTHCFKRGIDTYNPIHQPNKTIYNKRYNKRKNENHYFIFSVAKNQCQSPKDKQNNGINNQYQIFLLNNFQSNKLICCFEIAVYRYFNKECSL